MLQNITQKSETTKETSPEISAKRMAKVPSKHSLDQTQEFEGLLNNLQDWELAFKAKDKKSRPDANAKDKMDGVNAKKTIQKNPLSESGGLAKKFDYSKDYDALSRLSSGFLSEESSIDANSEKELGNEYFKQKKYNEAIDCYSRSIALSPTAVAYANRAMAFIKIKRFQEAENDCTEALNLDDRYIKAYSRRCTARKELGKLKESIDDAEFASRLEPHNQEIKKQYAEAKSLFQKEILKKASGALASSAEKLQKSGERDSREPTHKLQALSRNSSVGKVTEILEDHKADNTRKIPADTFEENGGNNMIEGRDADIDSEMLKRKPKNGKQDLTESVQELAIKAANLAKAEAAKNILPPNSAYQFEVSWRGLSGDRDLQSRLLKVTSPTALPAIFKNALSAPVLVDMIRCIATFFLEDMALGVEYLLNLTRVPRFDVLIMCLTSTDKAELHRIWDEVFKKATMEYSEILSNLRSRYGVKQ